MKSSNPRSSIALKMDQFYQLPSGLRYHYIDEGQGPPVVMVHGNPSWSIYYRNLVEALRSTHRCIVPDHIGCGFSDKPDDSNYAYTLSQRIEDLESLLESLNLTEPITLVVHDWGGAIGMGYATRHPEKIARLVILNTAAFHQHTAKPGAIERPCALVEYPPGCLVNPSTQRFFDCCILGGLQTTPYVKDATSGLSTPL